MNMDRLNELRSEVGADALAEVLEVFLEETDAVAQRLRDAAPAGGMAAEMHMLKGAALNLGFDDLAALCSTAERAAGTGPVDTSQVLECYVQSRAELVAAAPQFGLSLPDPVR
ncbi:MAG: Hpt domain-containing protein [Qingshengfaniella sp.]